MNTVTSNQTGMPGNAYDTFVALFRGGCVYDGGLPSKVGRDWLVEKEFAERGEGFNWLTHDGFVLGIVMGLGRTA